MKKLFSLLLKLFSVLLFILIGYFGKITITVMGIFYRLFGKKTRRIEDDKDRNLRIEDNYAEILFSSDELKKNRINGKQINYTDFIFLLKSSHLSGIRFDKFALEENWKENKNLTKKVASYFNNDFNKKIWVNKNYINVEIDEKEQIHKFYDIDHSECIIHTYIHLNDSNEIMMYTGVNIERKKDIILEFMYLINSLSAKKNDSNIYEKQQKMSWEDISSLLGEPFNTADDSNCIHFVSDKDLHIILSNRGGEYTLSLFPPNSIFEGESCLKEGKWV